MPKITFLPTFLTPEPISVTVDAHTTLQEAAEAAGVPMGDACGGNCGCSTCHVHIVEGFHQLEEMEDDEDDILGKADDLREESRLGCQVVPAGVDVVVRITRESQVAYMNEHPEHRGREVDIPRT